MEKKNNNKKKNVKIKSNLFDLFITVKNLIKNYIVKFLY